MNESPESARAVGKLATSAEIILFPVAQSKSDFPIGDTLEEQLHWVDTLSQVASARLADAESVLAVMRDQLAGRIPLSGPTGGNVR
jgi:hypothetical protein